MNKVKKIVPFVLSLIAVCWLFSYINLRDVAHTLSQANLWWISVSFGCAGAVLVLRALRWRYLFLDDRQKLSSPDAILIIALSDIAGLLLVGGGELLRLVTANKRSGIPTPALLGTLIIERALDMLVVAFLFVLFLGSQLFNPDADVLLGPLRFKTSLLVIGLTGIGIAGMFYFRLFPVRLLPSSVRFFLEKAADFIQTNITEPFYKSLKNNAFGMFMLFTAGIKIISGFQIWSLLQMYSSTRLIPFSGAFNISNTSAVATYFIPAQGGVGPWHFAAAKILQICRLDLHNSLVMATSLHLFILAFVLLSGSVAWVIYLFQKFRS